MDHSLVGDVTVLVTFAAGGQGHALFVGVVACDLLWKEGWDSVFKFQGVGREVFIVLIVVVQGPSCLFHRGANWPGRHHASTLKDMHKLLIVSPWRKGEDYERSTYKGGHNFVYRVVVLIVV
ncbi:hypothetical protein CRG98_018025 [Punica granatum]|uniref:Uncharacterized protein n=1 Tax=Punica granatum TaxID=22663 RepID=A0A2I0JZ16_PUNGR|nr:hypothetical protein CRG98_018025 [Punica granatum]